MNHRLFTSPVLRLMLLTFSLTICGNVVAADERTNYFNDPFLQVTNMIPDCPVPEGPGLTAAEVKAESHWRTERGTSCFQSGRCRLPNAYLYDREIIPRVKKAIEADGRFNATSIWVEGQRRWVWLKGCVRSQAESETLEQLVRSLDDVEAVINQLKVTPWRTPENVTNLGQSGYQIRYFVKDYVFQGNEGGTTLH